VTQPSTQDTTSEAQDFLVVMANLNKGRTVAELTTKMQELVAAVIATKKGGTLKLDITVTPIKNVTDDEVEVADRITIKLPTHDRFVTRFFVDDGSNLVRNPVNQANLF
jgi:hypothetical protein